uniref:peptidylprolyl isomerase n=1 Tax=Strongyloides stercoralis TaxID=6248 RepID=A0A0K0E524_STRER
MDNLNLTDNSRNIEFDDNDGGPYEDVVGTGILLKRVIKEGENDDVKAVDGDIVKISITYHGLGNSTPEEITFTLGYLLNIEGIELACKCMNVGEITLFKIKSHLAYGDVGVTEGPYNIPPNHDLVVQIHLISIVGHQNFLLDDTPVEELLEQFKTIRGRGKFYFQRNEIDRAMFVYNKLLNILQEVTINRCDELLLLEMSILQNNLASCYYKMDDYRNALKMSTAATTINPKNIDFVYKHLIILENLKLRDKIREEIESIYEIKSGSLRIRVFQQPQSTFNVMVSLFVLLNRLRNILSVPKFTVLIYSRKIRCLCYQ